MRAKVWLSRTTTTLFSCKMYATDIEKLYKLMWEKFSRGEKPEHIAELSMIVTKDTNKNIKITEMEKMTLENGTNYENNKESNTAELVIA